MARLWLGYADLALDKTAEAIAQLEAASAMKPNDADVWYALGQAYLGSGQDAIARLLAEAPDGGRLWQLTGEQYLLRGDHDEALRFFEGAAARRPDLAEVRQSIAELGGSVPATAAPPATAPQQSSEDRLYHAAHEDEAKAASAFARISEVAPGSYRAHQVIGNAFAAQAKPEEAIEEYVAALKIKPDLPGLHTAMANQYMRLGKPQAALAEFREEAKLEPFSAQAYEDEGRVLSALGKDDEACSALEHALTLDRPPLETYRLLGKIELHRKNYARAIALLSRYVREEPTDSTAWYLLAGAYRETGATAQRDSALAQYKATSQDAKERAHAEAAYRKLAGEETSP